MNGVTKQIMVTSDWNHEPSWVVAVTDTELNQDILVSTKFSTKKEANKFFETLFDENNKLPLKYQIRMRKANSDDV